MIAEIVGLGGSGKTLLTTILGVEIKKKWDAVGEPFELWYDYDVAFPSHRFHWGDLPNDLDSQLKYFGDKPGLVVGDEFYIYANSRNWKKNVDITEFFGQIRKVRKDFYFVNQLTGETDNRIREKAEYRIECSSYPPRPFIPSPTYKPVLFVYKCYALDWNAGKKRLKWTRMVNEEEAKRYYPLYKSYELISKRNMQGAVV